MEFLTIRTKSIFFAVAFPALWVTEELRPVVEQKYGSTITRRQQFMKRANLSRCAAMFL